jgi:hypothetical protein
VKRTDALTLAKKAGGSFDGSDWKLVCDFDEDELTAYATEAERMGFLRGLEAAATKASEHLTSGRSPLGREVAAAIRSLAATEKQAGQ